MAFVPKALWYYSTGSYLPEHFVHGQTATTKNKLSIPEFQKMTFFAVKSLASWNAPQQYGSCALNQSVYWNNRWQMQGCDMALRRRLRFLRSTEENSENNEVVFIFGVFLPQINQSPAICYRATSEMTGLFWLAKTRHFITSAWCVCYWLTVLRDWGWFPLWLLCSESLIPLPDTLLQFAQL